MEQLIKITSIPIQTVRLTQSARLVNSDSVDMERRKALARQISFQNRHTSSPSVSMEEISRINRTFSRRNAAPQMQPVSRQQMVAKQQTSVRPKPAATQQPVTTHTQTSSVSVSSTSINGGFSVGVGTSANIDPAGTVPTVAYEAAPITLPGHGGGASPHEFTSSYTAQRGALELRVAKGELTFLPPMVMTIVTQRPELRFEYLGDFNYVPPRTADRGRTINLST